MRRALVLAAAFALVFALSATANAAIRITKIRYDPPGVDTGSNPSLKAEYIKLTNKGSHSVNLLGWKVFDTFFPAPYTFGTFNLGAGKSVFIHTGHGKDTHRHKYWDLNEYVWDNDGDTATLKDYQGHKKDSCHYSGGPPGWTNC